MSELSFLIDLLLTEKLSKSVKTKVKDRVIEVEALLTSGPPTIRIPIPAKYNPADLPPHIAGQSPSTIAKFLEHQAQGLPPVTSIGEVVSHAVPSPPAVVAATPQTAAALQKREQAIQTALSGKPEPGRTSPRKF